MPWVHVSLRVNGSLPAALGDQRCVGMTDLATLGARSNATTTRPRRDKEPIVLGSGSPLPTHARMDDINRSGGPLTLTRMPFMCGRNHTSTVYDVKRNTSYGALYWTGILAKGNDTLQ